ncbi:5'-AMP-activated protein kinase subunit beta-1-like protein [Dinothrombium tinctorium]|uniref:5'-AMP-activated protein kinase subunit beta-1 n=1 Tax=Dinothrombium tinctorium TaxID=1965070 RepID=A0A443QCH2_9ACAR|nr:5'-AMP-activated protein kinase subunit beta-1-like protein [Dinothrombium tinctorium]
MGNTTASSGKRDRTFSIDISPRDSSSPRSEDVKSFEFAAGKKKPLLCYQSSAEYASGDDTDDYKTRPRARTISQGTSIDENALPTVFKWEGGGKEVYITGTFSEWKPIKMCPSHGDFIAIVDVPEGIHEYKFIVDGNETVNSSSKVDELSKNNVIHVKKGDFEVFEALAMDLASNTNNSTLISGSPPGLKGIFCRVLSDDLSHLGSYSQIFPSFLRQRSESGGNTVSHGHQLSGAGPPILPPHLLQVILNNPTVNTGEPTLLPQPNHVMLNHLYALSIKDGVMVLSCTHRYRKKYVTTLLYKPI